MEQRTIVLVGLNHRTAPVEVRERLAFGNGRLEPALRELIAVPGILEGAIVSTCNRVEVIACGADAAAVGSALPAFLAREHGVADPALATHLYTHADREAVRHLFRVAASLDSMVVGESQVLGQLKEQYGVAASVGASGRVLHRCFHKSFSVAKRVRSETGIAEKAVSVGSAAVELARGIFDRLEDKTAMLIGAGAMGELTARQLLAHGVGSVMVVNRTYERAMDVARELGGMPVPFDRLARYLPLADLVIGTASGEEFLLAPPLVDEAMRERRRRPMFFIDLAVPAAWTPVSTRSTTSTCSTSTTWKASSRTTRARGPARRSRPRRSSTPRSTPSGAGSRASTSCPPSSRCATRWRASAAASWRAPSPPSVTRTRAWARCSSASRARSSTRSCTVR